MIKPSLQGIKDALFYALYGTGGVILANESSKIPQTAQQAKGLENAIETASQKGILRCRASWIGVR